jgi:hypothetical protein
VRISGTRADGFGFTVFRVATGGFGAAAITRAAGGSMITDEIGCTATFC